MTVKKHDIGTEQSSRQNGQVKFVLGLVGLVMAITSWVCFANDAPVNGMWSAFSTMLSWWAALAIRAKWTS